MSLEKKVTFLSVALAISLVLIILLVTALIYSEQQTFSTSLDIYTKASIFDTKFHDIMQENTITLINTARRSLDSSASFNDSYNFLQVTNNELAAELSNFYGPAVGNQFRTILNMKTDAFINYSIALRNNDSTANSVFSQNIYLYEEKMTNFWSNQSNSLPNFDKALIKQAIADDAKNEKTALDFWNANDYPDYFAKLQDSYISTGVLADLLAQAIIYDNPDKFR